MSKLPPKSRFQIARNSKDSVWKTDELLSVIKIEVEAREASEMTKTSEYQESTQGSGQQIFRNQPPTLNFLVSHHTRWLQKQHLWVFCRNKHYSSLCDIVKDAAKQRNILEWEKQCFNCLQFGHDMKECQNLKACLHCSPWHHQWICPLAWPKFKTERKSPKETNKTTMTTVHNEPKGTFLTQTAKATAVNSGVTCGTQSQPKFLFEF